MKKFLIVFALSFASLCVAQTPCIDAAKQGKVEACLSVTVPVTDKDAKFVPGATVPVAGYVVDPTPARSIRLEFSTREQAEAIKALIQNARPDAKISIHDYVGTFSYPPFRKLQYFNTETMLAPRLYGITGTVGGMHMEFSVGWFINVIRLIYGGSFEVLDFQVVGMEFGNGHLDVIPYYGGATPVWVK